MQQVDTRGSEMKDISSLSHYHGQELDMRRMSANTSSSSFQESLDAEAGGSKAVVTFAPNRRLSTGGTVEGHVTVLNSTELDLIRQNSRPANVHPFINNFTSPIGMSSFFSLTDVRYAY